MQKENCFPKPPIDPAFINYPQGERLILTKDTLINDIDKVYSFCESIITYAILTAIYKVHFEWPGERTKEIEDKLEESKEGLLRIGLTISGDL